MRLAGIQVPRIGADPERIFVKSEVLQQSYATLRPSAVHQGAQVVGKLVRSVEAWIHIYSFPYAPGALPRNVDQYIPSTNALDRSFFKQEAEAGRPRAHLLNSTKSLELLDSKATSLITLP